MSFYSKLGFIVEKYSTKCKNCISEYLFCEDSFRKFIKLFKVDCLLLVEVQRFLILEIVF